MVLVELWGSAGAEFAEQASVGPVVAAVLVLVLVEGKASVEPVAASEPAAEPVEGSVEE